MAERRPHWVHPPALWRALPTRNVPPNSVGCVRERSAREPPYTRAFDLAPPASSARPGPGAHAAASGEMGKGALPSQLSEPPVRRARQGGEPLERIHQRRLRLGVAQGGWHIGTRLDIRRPPMLTRRLVHGLDWYANRMTERLGGDEAVGAHGLSEAAREVLPL
eukprot:CAMPEP_0174730130 /NCGR_PEP_ID=MMETSP1094-20130205/54991_1 /TAXON_ID=156173 /ORGANISM="Chrysochromulina brevifilum, Strain UTEX LB 985" /LENGTH=163 /DNA_ID=CAMNT_0015932343 /DNA_START=195 /DNA_END=687 /DNA_ORIENTATION=-